MKKIMVVDDNDDFLFTMKKVLSFHSYEYQVIPINSSKKCLNYLKKNSQPDLILLDLLLPEINGMELYEKIKQNKYWENIPILFTSAWDNMKNKVLANNLGEGFIEKPFNTEYIINRINNILEKK